MTSRTKALSITEKVRREVYERDSYDGAPCCAACGTPHNLSLHHIVPRSLSGLGIPRNLVVLCAECHDIADHGKPGERWVIRSHIEEIMKTQYPGWSESQLRYKREI